jgi:hypothetical protein
VRRSGRARTPKADPSTYTYDWDWEEQAEEGETTRVSAGDDDASQFNTCLDSTVALMLKMEVEDRGTVMSLKECLQQLGATATAGLPRTCLRSAGKHGLTSYLTAFANMARTPTKQVSEC